MAFLSLPRLTHSKLVLSLYQPNPPDVIATTQATLSRFQSSPQAWSMVRHLLERPDEKVKFFGALTVIIKLNNERCVNPLRDRFRWATRLNTNAHAVLLSAMRTPLSF